jgi:predicted RNase H-like nuclease (RuvC/YqgF family)
MADEEEFGSLLAENLSLKEIIAEQNETMSQLREHLATLNERLSLQITPEKDNTQQELDAADAKQALYERNELLKSWLQTAQAWESMFTVMEQENTRLRAALKAFTN